MKESSIVLLSGGLDSVVNLALGLEKTNVGHILTFDYGQEAAQKEILATQMIAEKYGIRQSIIRLDWLSHLGGGLSEGNIPDFDESLLDDMPYSLSTAKAVWVPNRNGVFINIAAGFADRNNTNSIVVGFNKEEGATFPDNTPEFIDAVNQSLYYSTSNHAKVVCYTLDMDKSAIVRAGIEHGAAFEAVWSCYHSYDKMCGHCESCKRLIRALRQNDFLDEFNRINQWGING